MAGQWCSPADPAMCAYGTGSTVGCLVCLDDESAFETWDGVMVKATTRFNINGVMVSPPVSTMPMSGAPASLPAWVNSPTSDGTAVPWDHWRAVIDCLHLLIWALLLESTRTSSGDSGIVGSERGGLVSDGYLAKRGNVRSVSILVRRHSGFYATGD